MDTRTLALLGLVGPLHAAWSIGVRDGLSCVSGPLDGGVNESRRGGPPGALREVFGKFLANCEQPPRRPLGVGYSRCSRALGSPFNTDVGRFWEGAARRCRESRPRGDLVARPGPARARGRRADLQDLARATTSSGAARAVRGGSGSVTCPPLDRGALRACHPGERRARARSRLAAGADRSIRAARPRRRRRASRLPRRRLRSPPSGPTRSATPSSPSSSS